MMKLFEFDLPSDEGTVTVSAIGHLVGTQLIKLARQPLRNSGLRLSHSCGGIIRIHHLRLQGHSIPRTVLLCNRCGSRTVRPSIATMRDLIRWVVSESLPREMAQGVTMTQREFDHDILGMP